MAENVSEKSSTGGIFLFRIAGIQIILDYSWFIIFALILWSLSAGYFPRNFSGHSTQAYWISGLIATFFFFFSVIAHELAHSLMALRIGIKIPEIRLFLFGGVARISEEAQNPKDEFAIAIVGPLSSFVLAFIFWNVKNLIAGDASSLIVAVFGYLAWINLALGIFNLIPGFPLDGGRILRAFWWWKTGSVTRATKVASDIGKGFAVALIILGAFDIFAGSLVGGLWFIFIGMFLRGVAEGGYQEVVMKQVFEGVRVEDVMVTEDVVSVSPDLFLKGLISQYFLRYGYKGFPVVENGNVLGVVPLEKIREIPEEAQETTTVRQVMVSLENDITIRPDDSLVEALKKMNLRGISRLVVMQENKMVGLITKTGLIRFMEIKRILEH